MCHGFVVGGAAMFRAARRLVGVVRTFDPVDAVVGALIMLVAYVIISLPVALYCGASWGAIATIFMAGAGAFSVTIITIIAAAVLVTLPPAIVDVLSTLISTPRRPTRHTAGGVATFMDGANAHGIAEDVADSIRSLQRRARHVSAGARAAAEVVRTARAHAAAHGPVALATAVSLADIFRIGAVVGGPSSQSRVFDAVSAARRPVATSDVLVLVGPPEASDMCPLCLDKFAEDTTKARCAGACKHALHVSCVTDWFKERHVRPCPMCRAPLDGTKLVVT